MHTFPPSPVAYVVCTRSQINCTYKCIFSFHFRTPISSNKKIIYASTSVPKHNLASQRIKDSKEEAIKNIVSQIEGKSKVSTISYIRDSFLKESPSFIPTFSLIFK